MMILDAVAKMLPILLERIIVIVWYVYSGFPLK